MLKHDESYNLATKIDKLSPSSILTSSWKCQILCRNQDTRARPRLDLLEPILVHDVPVAYLVGLPGTRPDGKPSAWGFQFFI
jgi:hypothetical protein